MQELWGKTRSEAIPQGTDTWKIDYRTAVKGLKQQEEALLSTSEQPTTLGEDPKAVIENFKTKYPALKLELSNLVTIWPLTLTVAAMGFEIGKQDVDDAKNYQIRAKAGKRISYTHNEIMKSVQQRKEPGSLAYLLVFLCSLDLLDFTTYR